MIFGRVNRVCVGAVGLARSSAQSSGGSNVGVTPFLDACCGTHSGLHRFVGSCPRTTQRDWASSTAPEDKPAGVKKRGSGSPPGDRVGTVLENAFRDGHRDRISPGEEGVCCSPWVAHG